MGVVGSRDLLLKGANEYGSCLVMILFRDEVRSRVSPAMYHKANIREHTARSPGASNHPSHCVLGFKGALYGA